MMRRELRACMTASVLALLAAALAVGCGSHEDRPWKEWLTGLSLEPAQPAAGELVQVQADYYSNWVGFDSYRPTIRYCVSGGELIGTYSRSVQTASGWEDQTVEVRGQDLKQAFYRVEWRLPEGVSSAWITAELRGSSRTLTVALQAP